MRRRLPETYFEPETGAHLNGCELVRADPGTLATVARDMGEADEAVPSEGEREVSPLNVTNPALVYLARLAPGSRRTMRQVLDAICGMVAGGKYDALTMPWHFLRYQHTQAVRARVAEEFAPSTANKPTLFGAPSNLGKEDDNV
jgi:hypothetical protein